MRELLRRRGALDETSYDARPRPTADDEGRSLNARTDFGGDEIPESWDRDTQRELPIE